MNEPPGARFRVGHAALTMAEYFRDDEHRDVLLLIENIFRFIQAAQRTTLNPQSRETNRPSESLQKATRHYELHAAIIWRERIELAFNK